MPSRASLQKVERRAGRWGEGGSEEVFHVREAVLEATGVQRCERREEKQKRSRGGRDSTHALEGELCGQ